MRKGEITLNLGWYIKKYLLVYYLGPNRKTECGMAMSVERI